MKTLKSNLKLLLLAILTLLVSIGLTSCDENPEVVTQDQILPESFGIEIPSSINSATINAGGKINGKTEDELAGDDIYGLLRVFIHVGDGSRRLVEDIIIAIRRFDIQNIEVITYQSDDDGRSKTMTVEKNVDFEGKTWSYQLTVVDSDSENDADGGKAMQVFWNNDPVEGIAILKPYNINRSEGDGQLNAMYRIDYNSAGNDIYDATMEVAISGLRTDRPQDDDFAMRKLRMFVGRTGDVVDVFGNSNHPRARLFPDSENPGFNWAFVASGDDSDNIGVAEVGLPPSALDSDNRSILLEDYSIRNVFTERILNAFPNIPQSGLDAFLVNTNPPGYFDKNGFLSAGASPGDSWNPLANRIQDLAPYNPLETTNLEIAFK
ncbi:MAG: hypothetical protein RLO81_16690 [Fulvivirga sp.]|uniref:hypothetical protein n=1 Tax=Fulvivirga sp. TaxID=1931237 RepID=UPI0032EB6ED7